MEAVTTPALCGCFDNVEKLYYGDVQMLFGNRYNSLFLKRLHDTDNNELSVFIAKSKEVNPSLNSIEDEKTSELLSKTMQLVPDDTQMYRVHFENYIMYQGRNESYAYDDDCIGVGQGLIVFEKSKLLDYVNSVIDIPLAIDMQRKNKLQHYGIYTLNNIIDVITFHEPIIEKVTQIV